MNELKRLGSINIKDLRLQPSPPPLRQIREGVEIVNNPPPCKDGVTGNKINMYDLILPICMIALGLLVLYRAHC